MPFSHNLYIILNFLILSDRKSRAQGSLKGSMISHPSYRVMMMGYGHDVNGFLVEEEKVITLALKIRIPLLILIFFSPLSYDDSQPPLLVCGLSDIMGNQILINMRRHLFMYLSLSLSSLSHPLFCLYLFGSCPSSLPPPLPGAYISRIDYCSCWQLYPWNPKSFP